MCVRRMIALIVAGVIVATWNVPTSRAQGNDEFAKLDAEFRRLFGRNNAEATAIAERSVALASQRYGESHIEFAKALDKLVIMHTVRGRYREAEEASVRALGIAEKALGANDPDVGRRVRDIALLPRDPSRYGEAIPFAQRSAEVFRQHRGENSTEFAQAIGWLGSIYQKQGMYSEAEQLYKRALAIHEGKVAEDADVYLGLKRLAELFQAQRRYDEAEPLLKRSLAITEKRRGLPNHRSISGDLQDLAKLYQGQGRYSEAEPLFRRSIEIIEKEHGPDAFFSNKLSVFARFHQTQGRYDEAEALYRRALTIDEAAGGYEHPSTGRSLLDLGVLYRAQGRFVEAEPLFKRTLAIYEKHLGSEHPIVGWSLNNLAQTAFAQQDWKHAIDYWRRSTSAIVRRAERGTLSVGQNLKGAATSEGEQLSGQFWGMVKAGFRAAKSDGADVEAVSRDMFETAQWLQSSEAAQSMVQMAVRAATHDAALNLLIRERQDLVAEWQRLEILRTSLISQPPAKRNTTQESANSVRLAAIDSRIAQINRDFQDKFPNYAALTSLSPIPASEVQALLKENEALVLFLDTRSRDPLPEETFIWVVTKADVRWVRSELGTSALQREVASLRCGLDYDGTWGATNSHCSELLKINYSQIDHLNSKPLPFDGERAYLLYKALFGLVEDIIADKHLLIVPSGALTQLPLQVLVSEKPRPPEGSGTDFRRMAWLVRKHAVTVLPSVSSLKALRMLAKDSHADRTMIGFGNPLLDGPDASYAKWASAARSKQSCPAADRQQLATVTGERLGVLPLDLRRGLADVTQIRMQVPLPETADELCAVARDLGVKSDEIRLGARATEAEIKRLSDAGELSKYRIIHFATHGTLAGQIDGKSEPGLFLTPPDQATQTDDGYLSTSEIAALKLDASWVILSACNTAAGGSDGAEALSGLARAFFYAGARALLVSHWSVYSEATVKLVTGAVSGMNHNKHIGRSQAIRESMLAMIDKGEPLEAHPAYWAPFVVVGEGAAR